jgi:hypothetical protein
MYKLQLWLASIALLTGLVMAGIYLFAAHFLGAVVFFVAGILGAIFTLVGWSAFEATWYQFSCGIFTLFCIMASFQLSPAPQFDVQRAQFGLMSTLLNITNVSLRQPLDGRERALAEKAITVCGQQGNADFQDLTIDLEKALRFGPIMTLFDGMATLAQGDRPMRCLDYYRELRKTRPDLFRGFEKENPVVAQAATIR